jgi:hypothetical protein
LKIISLLYIIISTSKTNNISILKMSYPYVPGQEVISFDANGKIIVDNTYAGIFDDLKEDKSYQTVMRMQVCIYANDFEGFKKIYEEEYISNPEICDFFKFDEEEHNWWVNTYSLCECANKADEPDRIHRHMYVRPCSCANGKRYLAYLCAFNASFKEENYYYDTNPRHITEKPVLTNFQKYLSENGPLDLTYKELVYKV